ncbi:MAG: formate acetyltransferase [Clostridia bacterium]|nr:formate acetyltransferase [Clostridia bacterium]
MSKALSYQDRLDRIREIKMIQTKEKQRIYGTDGYWDMDDKGLIAPPESFTFTPESDQDDGEYYGAKMTGLNYRKLLESHPVYINPMSSLAGGWMYSFYDIKKPKWDSRIDYSFLHELQEKYDLVHGIGGIQHFNVDIQMGLTLGFDGLLEKINKYEKLHGEDKKEFYQAERDVVLGMLDMIRRHAAAAKVMAETETREDIKENLLKMASVNEKLLISAPETFHEACQWVAWFILFAVMYDFNGAGGSIDKYLRPFYERDIKEGILTEEEAVFHLACLLVVDNAYYEIGGTYEDGRDRTNKLTYLVIEAAHRIRIPTSICLRVHDNMDKGVLELAVKYLFEDDMGTPSFLGHDAVVEGFMKNGYPIELARQREKTGCHWCALPGREYTLNDIVKISFLAVYDVAFKEVINDSEHSPSVERIWDSFVKHLSIAVDTIAAGMDFHLKHMHKVFPELMLNLLCHGPIEKGLDISNGGVEYYNLCVDGAGLATVADSFAAIKQRVEIEKRISWEKLKEVINNDFEGAENIRLMLKNIKRFGNGDSIGDEFAKRISETFTQLVKEKPTPEGRNMIPGLFSWANTIPFGKKIGASANGRHAHMPISHGANPDPGFSDGDTPTAMAKAVASVQCGYGNTAPLQLEFDPKIGATEEGIKLIVSFIESLFHMGGTLLNINLISKEKILEAHKDPSLYPELVVRVTGFSAYFASLSEEFRQLVVNRIVEG